ncbi:hypothetical protein [Sinomonas sp. P47F7]|uniref:exo-rhamnogalacturonan lyase family protein n=1 Tax=Sinomonas sp. P47F7 TaxID=3410987 RepID=UPI003BF4DA05
MQWLDGAPRARTATDYGYPWNPGELLPEDVSRLAAGPGVEHEARLLATWPDGSVKWTGHTAIVGPETDPADLAPGADRPTPGGAAPLAVQDGDGVLVDSGALAFRVDGHGETLTGPISSPDGRIAASGLRLVASLTGGRVARVSIDGADVETPGAVRAVVRVHGTVTVQAAGEEGGDPDAAPNAAGEELLAFVVRLTVHRGLPRVAVTQTLVFREAAADRVIAGLGLRVDRPLRGEPINRWVRVAGDAAVYTEPAQLLMSRPFAGANAPYDRQLQALPVAEPTGTAPEDERERRLFAVGRENAVWAAFRLTQESDASWRLEKQTAARLAPVKIGRGRRALGLIEAADGDGGLALSLRGFWRKHPAALEVEGLDGDAATVTAWVWAERGGPMDLRHYTDRCHVESAYEGFDELRSTPHGVANTSHVVLDVTPPGLTAAELWELASERDRPAQPVAEPARYAATSALGAAWSLPEPEASPLAAAIEARFAELRGFYAGEVERRGWFGYWDYGDVMHSYDPHRHQWRYDLGGFAWANNELCPNLWLWQDFLRTGSAEAYRLAEAMTWHSAEVDRHHDGPYAQLGSRHNVLHWGCGCKEVRISMATLHRPYYYLGGGDERIGELLAEVSDAEHALGRLDPMREFYPRPEGRTHVRIGPDWAALVANWATAWERTGSPEHRDKILKGLAQLEAMPLGLLSGPTLEFDPDALDLHHMGLGTAGGFHMIIAFGAPQAWLETAELLDHDGFRAMLADFGAFYAMDDGAKRAVSGGALDDSHFSWPYMASGMMAYAAWYRRDEKLAAHAWKLLLDAAQVPLGEPLSGAVQRVTTWTEVEELPWLSTNWTSQWCLNAMLALALVGPPDALRWGAPSSVPAGAQP